ncbi:MAG: c-type cytochrome [Gemmatimonadota bacterium]
MRKPIANPRVAGTNALTAVVALTALGFQPLAAQTRRPFPGDPASGSRIFVERGCVRCHSIWGNGGSLGPDFATVGADHSLQQLAGLFWNHTPRMIETVRGKGFEWPQFTEQELADIISYINYVKLFDEPGDAEQGERWFREKRCVECHSLGGHGGQVGVPLDSYARYLTPIALARGMWNHGQMMRSQQSIRGVPVPTFVGREMADIQAYIRRASNARDRKLIFLRPPDPNRGRELFRLKKCVRCHGRDGRGSSFAPDLRAATQRLRVGEITGDLWNHSLQMSGVMRERGIGIPRFAEGEMADVISFLYYLRFYESGGDVRSGELTFERKRCSNCHSTTGRPSVGPNLARSKAVLTQLGLATAMWNHAPAMYDRVQVANVEWPRFEGHEMRDLSAYLRALAREQSPER